MCLYNNTSLRVHCARSTSTGYYPNADSTLAWHLRRWPNIKPTFEQNPFGKSARVVDSYFRNWYYARVKWATPILVIAKRCFSFHGWVSYSAVKAKTLSAIFKKLHSTTQWLHLLGLNVLILKIVDITKSIKIRNSRIFKSRRKLPYIYTCICVGYIIINGWNFVRFFSGSAPGTHCINILRNVGSASRLGRPINPVNVGLDK